MDFYIIIDITVNTKVLMMKNEDKESSTIMYYYETYIVRRYRRA